MRGGEKRRDLTLKIEKSHTLEVKAAAESSVAPNVLYQVQRRGLIVYK